MGLEKGGGKGFRNLFSLCADACGESDEIVSLEKAPGTYFRIDAVARAGTDRLVIGGRRLHFFEA